MGRTGNNVQRQDKKSLAPLPGAVVTRYHRCGKLNCRCTRGALHGPYYHRMWRQRGRVRCTYVRKRDVERVRQACAVYAQQREEERQHERRILAYSRMSARKLIALLREVEGWEL